MLLSSSSRYKYELVGEQSQDTRLSGGQGVDQRGALNLDSRREEWEFPSLEAEIAKSYVLSDSWHQ